MTSVAARLLVVVGVRPQYIKARAFLDLVADFEKHTGKRLSVTIIDTGQHYNKGLEPSQVLGLQPDAWYQIRHMEKDAFKIFARSIESVGEFIRSEGGLLDAVVVFGDANPALVGALAAVKNGYPLVHIEAGARRSSFEQEELNRRMIDSVASLRLCVTEYAVEVLRSEGRAEANIWTGDLWYRFLIATAASVGGEPLLDDRERLLVTIHRPQNSIEEVIQVLIKALESHGRAVTWITHPRTHRIVHELCSDRPLFFVQKAQDYPNIVAAVLKSTFVLTDSGGLIREAHHLKRRVLLLRDAGGWPELIDRGWNRRVLPTFEAIVQGLQWAEEEYRQPYLGESPLIRQDGPELAFRSILDFISEGRSRTTRS